MVNNLSTAEESLEVAKQSAGTSVLSAQIAVADLRLKLIDSKSAVAIAVKDAEKLVERLKSTDASPEQIAQAEKRVVDLKIEVAEAKSISIEKILAAQEALQDVLANPRSTSVEIAKATAAFIDSRTPSFEEATKILSDADDDPTLPLVIKGVVDNPREGSVVFFDNNDSKSIQVVALNNSVVRLQSNEGFNLTISSRNTNGEPVALGSNGQILVKHDNTISISGQGFAPNSLAKTWLFSSPRELGEIIVNPDGTFAADHPIGNDIKVGLHTAQINGTSPDGEVRSLSISLEVVPNVGPAPFDPLSQPGKVLTLVAELVTLLAIAGASSGGGAGAGRRREEDEEDERESAEVAEVSAAFGSVGVDRDRDRLPVLVVDAVDRVSVGASRGVVGLSPMLARVLGDGVYLRSIMGVLWLVLPFVGAGFGFGAASSAGFDAVMPSLFWLSALVVLGVFDAFSGFVGAFVFGSAVGFGGGVVSGDSVRGLLGVWVFCFAAPLIAGAVRPFRRVRGGSTQIVWDRCVDFVLIVLFGAWVAGSMYSALPGLTGFNSPSAGYVNHVRLVVLVALTIRFVLENFAVAVTPVRLKALTREPLPEPTLQQQISSAIVRTGVYMFVAVVFIGNNWALWLGGVLYLVPKLVSLGVDKLPDMRTVHRYLPRGIFKVVLMLFVAKWWGGLVAAQIDNPADMIKFGFVLLGIPGLALGAVGWFARSSRPWPSTIVTKLLGLVLLVVGVLVVLNIWLAI